MIDWKEHDEQMDQMWSMVLERRFEMSQEDIEKVRRAGLLSDVGKAMGLLYDLAERNPNTPEGDQAIVFAVRKVTEFLHRAGVRSSPQPPEQP